MTTCKEEEGKKEKTRKVEAGPQKPWKVLTRERKVTTCKEKGGKKEKTRKVEAGLQTVESTHKGEEGDDV